MYLLEYSWVLLNIEMIFGALQPPDFDATFVALERYLQKVPAKVDRIFSAMAVTGTNFEHTKDVASRFLIQHPEPTIIMNNYHLHLNEVKIIFNFLESPEDLSKILEKSNRYAPFGFVQFVICQPVDTYIWLEDAFRLLWESYMVNYVLVYVRGGLVETVSYNPFNRTLLNHTNKELSVKAIFPDKLANLYRYALKLSVFDDPPRITFRNGSCFGKSCNLLRYFCKSINATYKYLEPPLGESKFEAMHAEVLSGKADFSIVSQFLTSDFAGKFSYPLKMDDVVLVVQTGAQLPHYLSMLFTFSANLWTALHFLNALTVITLYIFSKLSLAPKSVTSCFFDVFAISCNTQLVNFHKNQWPTKLILIGWVLMTVILGFAFQSVLTSTLITPKYYETINSLYDLEKSSLGVCIPPGFAQRLPQDMPLRNRFINRSTDDIIQSLLNKRETQCAFALPWSYFTPIFKVDASLHRLYQVVEEPLVPGFGVLFFHHKSPYVGAVDKFARRDVEFSLSTFNNPFASELVRTHLAKSCKHDDETVILTLMHLQGIFYVLALGWFVAVLVFVFEMLFPGAC